MLLLGAIIKFIREWWTLQQAEVILDRHLQHNSSFPFKERVASDGSLVFLYSRRIPYLYCGLVGVVFSCFSFLVYALVGGDQVSYFDFVCGNIYSLCDPTFEELASLLYFLFNS